MSSLYKQTLDILARQTKSLADAIDRGLVTESTVPLRRLDWRILKDYAGLVLAWDDKALEHSPDSTNERDMRGYPGYFLFIMPPRPGWDERQEFYQQLKQSIRRYYNYRRRMGDIQDTDVNEIQCRVVENFPQPPREFGAEVDGLTVISWYLEPRTA